MSDEADKVLGDVTIGGDARQVWVSSPPPQPTNNDFGLGPGVFIGSLERARASAAENAPVFGWTASTPQPASSPDIQSVLNGFLAKYREMSKITCR